MLTATASPPAAAPPNPLHSSRQMAELIGSVTGEPPPIALERLTREYRQPGVSVADEHRARGLEPFVWSDELIRFYGETDGFLYELAVWNRNRIKSGMRRWTARALSGDGRGGLDVLALGDGLGFDCLRLARAGHRVTYFEVPGYTETFARRLFSTARVEIEVLTDADRIGRGRYDVVVCLDVLEHIPDPPAFLARIGEYLRPAGRLVVHAPFYMIHRAYPTHLKCNRRFSGSLGLYEQTGFRLLDGRPFWNPLLLGLGTEGASPGVGPAVRRAIVRLTGAFFALGRYTVAPFVGVHLYRRLQNRWFDEKKP
ncbi:MAG: methyltransferase domain-containing protein [Planctomycetes bacterium]|nr:methyltransferase domain-containing protein [Planctomycetota bacterium]